MKQFLLRLGYTEVHPNVFHKRVNDVDIHVSRTDNEFAVKVQSHFGSVERKGPCYHTTLEAAIIAFTENLQTTIETLEKIK